ncbi:DUF1328 family protein [Bythopirellula goksoeyrii]|uniref:Uncharacterized protein n=1 Tax=Bythopirellula goksoeyrii TaxID=1400387 RepID=A0A5B9QDH7_9BACT|nr:DUF1328 family protein [Bythopirellula goksoeyrii]QEG37127.1 hypothetical protein Pr1d_44670 [Bythopirellula goksoeyrii]
MNLAYEINSNGPKAENALVRTLAWTAALTIALAVVFLLIALACALLGFSGPVSGSMSAVYILTPVALVSLTAYWITRIILRICGPS